MGNQSLTHHMSLKEKSLDCDINKLSKSIPLIWRSIHHD